MLNINGNINEGTNKINKRKEKERREGRREVEGGNLRLINLQHHGLKYRCESIF